MEEWIPLAVPVQCLPVLGIHISHTPLTTNHQEVKRKQSFKRKALASIQWHCTWCRMPAGRGEGAELNCVSRMAFAKKLMESHKLRNQ